MKAIVVTDQAAGTAGMTLVDDAGGVDLVFDVIGGGIQERSAALVRAGGTLVSVVGPAGARPAGGLAVDFVVESDRAQLGEIVRRCGTDGCGRTSATSRPSTTPPPPSTRPGDAKGRRSSAFVREDSSGDAPDAPHGGGVGVGVAVHQGEIGRAARPGRA